MIGSSKISLLRSRLIFFFANYLEKGGIIGMRYSAFAIFM